MARPPTKEEIQKRIEELEGEDEELENLEQRRQKAKRILKE